MNSLAVGHRQRASGVAELHVKARSGTTVVDHLYQQGCAKIRLPGNSQIVTSETDATNTGCHPCKALEAVLINTSGGLTGDDNLTWKLKAQVNTHLRATTAACEKIYRTHGPAANQQTHLIVDNYARLDWLPQETIVFDQAALRRTLQVDLAKSASVLISEAIVLGRTAMAETVNTTNSHDNWRIYRDGQLIHAEALRLHGQLSSYAQHRCVMHSHSAFATLVLCTPAPGEVLQQLADSVARLAPGDTSTCVIGCSAMHNKLIVRMLAVDGFVLRQYLIPSIELLSAGLPLPRVWYV